MKSDSLEIKSYDKQWWADFRKQEVDAILALTAKKNADYTGGNSCVNPFANFDQSVEFGVSSNCPKSEWPRPWAKPASWASVAR